MRREREEEKEEGGRERRKKGGGGEREKEEVRRKQEREGEEEVKSTRQFIHTAVYCYLSQGFIAPTVDALVAIDCCLLVSL